MMMRWLKDIGDFLGSPSAFAPERRFIFRRGRQAQLVSDRQGQGFWLFIESKGRDSGEHRFCLQPVRWAWHPRFAFCDVREDGPGVLFISDLLIHQDYRRRGLATLLIQALLGWAQMQGHQRIWAKLFASDLRETPFVCSFWERQGFQVVTEPFLHIQRQLHNDGDSTTKTSTRVSS
jgi:GNAT superfamily N-acetyltransferase